ncbi:zinc-binding metallopeptidase family protein [Haloferula sargassicola]|uniref:Uncharacterized protein Rv2568c n=1 Tax=Haloferula sargassicola TaxID=490096 RepID=A0ABP9UPT7_9BACT
MQIFHCDECSAVVFFENDSCLSCGAKLAFLPEVLAVGAVKQDADGLWRSPRNEAAKAGYRLCRNGLDHQLCNEAIPADSDSPLCRWCQFTEIIPDLSFPENLGRWRKLNAAQRRLLYSLTKLDLPLKNRMQDPVNGLGFRFLADTAEQVMTGHENGVITLNIAEADDAEREGRREQMGERYRTLLGHFRHEVGHYFWDRLIRDGGRLDAFRERFGDEREDYNAALQRHYAQGAPAGWEQTHISRYASMHPWEDWAETWAHYLHLTAVLETAASCGLSLEPQHHSKPAVDADDLPDELGEGSFDQLIRAWLPVTYALNSLNRSIGLNDAYPFVLSAPVIDKLRFIHRVIRSAS